MIKYVPVLLLISAWSAWGQANHGELRLILTDPTGAALRAPVEVVSRASEFQESIETNDQGRAVIPKLPFGTYSVKVEQTGFAGFHTTVTIQSAVPVEVRVQLAIAGASSEVHVTDRNTLVDLNNPFSAMQIGAGQIEDRLSSLPGRSLQDLVVSQPGWLYEGNAVLHPRGSEYQTQFVADGIPLTDNRSPGLGPEIEADDVESMSIYTAGFPAEYGRKMGGVVELNTRRQANPGMHGNLALSGGSYDTQSGYGQLQETGKRDSLTGSASGGHTERYLNPVVPENYTNTGTLADFAASYEHEFDENDRLVFSGRRDLARYLIPNEQIQQQDGQVQNADNFESIGSVHYQHLLPPNGLILLSGMFRENSRDLESNRNPTPIAAFQHNHFGEAYFTSSYTLHHGHNEWKAGVESDSTFLHEDFRYNITDPSQFDPGTAPSFNFADHQPDLEQSAFVEDLVHLGEWSASFGLRWDHYQLLLNRQALSPRLAAARAFPSTNLVIHGSYDRVFQTPALENILLSSSPQLSAISNQFLRLPVEPSAGNDWEIGVTKGFANRTRLDINTYDRRANNAADDSLLLNTGLSFPIAFARSTTYGAEGKLQVVAASAFSGFFSYSYMVAEEWFPVTGGLFLGQDASDALSQLSGHFAATQDQRNTVATRWEWRANKRISFAGGGSYGSGLPFDYGGTYQQALNLYGPAVVSRLNFAGGRVLPMLALNASMSAELYRQEKLHVTLHMDGENLNNRLNVLDFGGLFSGNAIGPGRSLLMRLDARF